ncbi:hypothetical protein ASF22_06615 [Methylobacterium sp. Leaf87]|nr:hypothetical protein ASF22_06615 [Methylobacterium sp. Leaf87]
MSLKGGLMGNALAVNSLATSDFIACRMKIFYLAACDFEMAFQGVVEFIEAFLNNPTLGCPGCVISF